MAGLYLTPLQVSPHMHLLGHKNSQELLSPHCPSSPCSGILTNCSILLVFLKIRAVIPQSQATGINEGSPKATSSSFSWTQGPQTLGREKFGLSCLWLQDTNSLLIQNAIFIYTPTTCSFSPKKCLELSNKHRFAHERTRMVNTPNPHSP